MNNLSTKQFNTPQSLNLEIKQICDILRRSNCSSVIQYIRELTWLLFLRIVDEQEELAQKFDKNFTFSIASPYRWSEWGAPLGWKRLELQQITGLFYQFVNQDLLPYLQSLQYLQSATQKQKIISQIISGINHLNIDTEINLLQVLDKVDRISLKNINTNHIFTLSQMYEGLLLKMGEKANDGGQFFTPRAIVKVIIQTINPQIGETIYDPCCGTGGFLAESYQHITANLNQGLNQGDQQKLLVLKQQTFYGKEKESLIYPITLANLVLHGIESPNIKHENTLSNQIFTDYLFQPFPEKFDIILTNPPFGGKENKEVQSYFPYPTSATQVLFIQHIIKSLKTGGRAAIIVDEGFLFRNNESAFIQTKQKLLAECHVWCIISLPVGVFINTGTSLKTNILFFTKGRPTDFIWYYDLSQIKIGKKTPLELTHFEHFWKCLPDQKETAYSWRIDRSFWESNHYNLQAVNPFSAQPQIKRTKDELVQLITLKNQEIIDIIKELV